MSPIRLSQRTFAATALSAVAMLAAACAQSTSASTSSAGEAATVTATGAKPAAFASGNVKVALVRQSGAGDYFEQWGSGAQKQAAAISIDLTVYDAQNDNAKQATDLTTAINSGVKAIIVDHGFQSTIDPVLQQAVDKGITVIAYDLVTSVKGVITTEQDDTDMATKVLTEAAKSVTKGDQVGYVNVSGYAALDKRDTVWGPTVAKNGWTQAFKVGKVTTSTATDNVPLVSAALTQNPVVKAIFAPYDELAKGAVLAVQNNNLAGKVKVYGIDISNADIQIITAANSPWAATASTDPSAVGSAVVRTAALQIAGQLNKSSVSFPAVLITQDLLRSKNISNMTQLRAALPDLSLSGVSTANWITNVAY
jgi:simple sugar transport system substrate-binding protein